MPPVWLLRGPQATSAAKERVSAEGYQGQLKREGLCEISRYYLCAAFLLEADGECVDAGWLALKAAWGADDCYDPKFGSIKTELRGVPSSEAEPELTPVEVPAFDAEGGNYCRRLSIGYLQAARERGSSISNDPAAGHAVLTDLYRRVGDFEAARAAAHAGLDAGADGLLFDVLNFQLGLIDAKDVGCHNLGELGDEGERTIYL